MMEVYKSDGPLMNSTLNITNIVCTLQRAQRMEMMLEPQQMMVKHKSI
jgi:hypothetical protein